MNTTPQNSIMFSPSKNDEFLNLYKDFSETYLRTKQGREHLFSYEKSREEARINFQDIILKFENGIDVTDAVLLKLLPYTNSIGNRERGAWIHVAPSIRKDLKDWFQKAGLTKPEDWPNVAEAILRFVQRCESDPDQLSEACNEFSSLPYSKGFQTGMLTPILNALRPDDFVLINNKSRQGFNYFAGTNYEQPLKNYPEVNATAKLLINEVGSVLRESAMNLEIDALDSDMFDMFSHWLVAVKKYFKPAIETLGVPFSHMFANSNEADWAFDLMKETAERLGVHGPDDLLASFTLRKRSGEFLLRLSYARWLVLGFEGYSKSLKSITVPFLTNLVDIEYIWKSEFSQPELEPAVALYKVPIDKIHPFEDNLRKSFEETLDFISNRFIGWEKSPYRNRSNKKIAEAVFDLEKRNLLLREGISPVEIVEEENGGGIEISEPQFWKIAPEAVGRLWSFWRDKGYISIGWDDLGDLSGVTREEFVERRDEAIAENPSWKEEDCEQVWNFINMQAGDHVIANRGASLVLGIGTIIGSYFFVENEEHGHRMPVRWDVTTPRKINEPGWGRALIKLDKEKFDEILALPEGQVKVNSEYTLSDFAQDTGFNITSLRSWVKAIDRKGQAILFGPPGTGKTFMAERLAMHLISQGDGFVDTVQFHPAYSYEDFIQGIRPRTRPDGGLEYPLLPGRFLQFCTKAAGRIDCCVLIIDEINRANLARVFGELMYLLEYRDKSIILAGGETFRIPSNVSIIGTMNTADRSIALVDHALRRRFAFLELYPEMEVLRKFHENTGFRVNGLINELNRLNQRIDDPHYSVGISFFLRSDLSSQIEDIWKMEIEPYLKEYFFDHLDWAREFSWDKVKAKILI